MKKEEVSTVWSGMKRFDGQNGGLYYSVSITSFGGGSGFISVDGTKHLTADQLIHVDDSS